MEQAGRIEKIDLALPANVRVESAPAGRTLSEMLEMGAIDGIIGPRLPSCFERGDPHVDWLFRDPTRAATDYYRRTGIFPIMHILGIRRELVERHPWLPATVAKAFEQSKAHALAQLTDTSATKVTLPFVEEQLRAARQLMGEDFWSYGVAPNRKCWRPPCATTMLRACRRGA
jgi:4,5-dihydroxyphthalate decarboxylase